MFSFLVSIAYLFVYVCVCRSQQDTAGERERRQREIEKVEEMLCLLRGELDEVFARRRSADEAMKVIEDRRRQQE